MAAVIPIARASDRKFTSSSTIVMLGHSHWLQYVYGQWARLIMEHYRSPIAPTYNLCPTILNKGVNGQLIAQFTARVGTDVTPFSPAMVVVSDPTNDVGVTSTNQLQTNYQALVTALLGAGVPASGIVLCNQGWSGNTFPEANISTINAFNGVIAGIGAANNCPVLDIRTPYFNARTAGGQAWTDDGIHPTAGTNNTNHNGDVLYGAAMMGSCVFQQ